MMTIPGTRIVLFLALATITIANTNSPDMMAAKLTTHNTFQYRAPPGVTLLKVPEVQWVPDKLFANEIATRDRPVVIKNAPVKDWKAMSWTPQNLANRLGNLNNVKRTSNANQTFYYCHDGPFDNVPGIGDVYHDKCHGTVDMTPAEFVALLDPPNGLGPFYYCYSSTLDEWGEQLVAEVTPVEPIMVLPPEWTPETSNEFRQTVVWMGQPGSVTPAHFDLPHNFFTQIYGQKHFTLFPPNAWERLYVWPQLHPGAQSAQVNLAQPDHASFPNYAEIKGFEATLQPGDVLYVPPLWFHHVTALNVSLSVSVWSHFKGASVYEEMIEKLQLPLLRKWTKTEKVAALRIFLESLVANLKLPGDHNIASFIHWALLENRYKFIGPDPTPEVNPKRQRFCANEAMEEAILNEGKEILTNGLKEGIKYFDDILKYGGAPRRDIFLANFIELLTNSVVGVEHVREFLYDVCYC